MLTAHIADKTPRNARVPGVDRSEILREIRKKGKASVVRKERQKDEKRETERQRSSLLKSVEINVCSYFLMKKFTEIIMQSSPSFGHFLLSTWVSFMQGAYCISYRMCVL